MRAEAARAEYNRALHYLTPATENWRPRAYTASALEDAGIDKLWEIIESFQEKMTASGAWQVRREAQQQAWLHTIIAEQLQQSFYTQPAVQDALPELETAVRQNILPPTAAALKLLQIYRKSSPLE